MIVRHHARAILLSLRRLLCLSVLLLPSSLPTISQAQITLDGSLGYRGALHGPNYTISDRVGQIRGPNLFHSFGQFNLSKGESATFTGPNTIANILSRVTGGSPSNIDGTIRSQIPKANFYLINPSGVMFGPNASLDVSGSFHVSTADYLRLADGATFSAHLAVLTVLSVAPPAAFGFLGPTPAAISIQGSALHVPPGQTLSVIGGDIEIVGGVLVASGGRINLGSVAAAGEVGMNPADPTAPLQVGTFAHLGRIDLVDAFLDASGLGGGTVVIRGGRLLVDQSFVFADTQGAVDGVKIGVDINVAGEVAITNGSGITTDALGAGHAGDIRIRAKSIEASDTAFIASRPFSTGDGGDIVVEVGRLTLTRGAQINTSTFSVGRGGSVTVTASDTLTLAGSSPDGTFASGIFAGTEGPEAGAGAAGSVVVSAPRIMVTGGAQIGSGSFGQGQGGSVTVTASDTLTLTGTGTGSDGAFASAIFADAAGPEAGAGAAGTIVVSAPRIMVTSGAQISSLSLGPGQGGSVIVTASDTLTLAGTTPAGAFPSGIFATAEGTEAGAGAAGSVVVSAPRIMVTDGAAISSGTGGPGRGGNVTVRASETLTITGRDADRFVSGVFSSTSGSGAAGRVTVSAPTLNMDNGFIQSLSVPGSIGDAGTVVVEGRTITLSGGAQIDTSTLGAGRGGEVTVRASEALTVTAPGQDAGGFFVISGVFSNTFGSGAAGRVTVAAPTLRMDNGQITSESQGGTGDAGTVVVEGETIALSGGAQISSGTFGAGRGGDVTVRVSEALTIMGRREADAFRSGVSSSTVGSGAAGRVTVTAPTLRMDDGVIQARAGQRPSGAAGSILTLQEAPDATGDAGSILITAGSITLTGGAQIDSRTGGIGRGGLVVVTATDTVSMGGSSRDGNLSGLVSLTSSTAPGAGDAGTVLLAAPHVQLTDGGQIQTSTSGAGNAGTIVVGAFEQQVEGMTIRGPQVEQVTLTGGAQITSSSGRVDVTGAVVAGSGRGGTVTVTTTDALIIAGHDPTGTEPSGVFSQTFGAGEAGRVALSTGQLRLEDGGRVSVDTGGDGRGGDLTVQARQVTIAGGAQLNSRSGFDGGNNVFLVGAGAGGTVTVTTTDTVTITGQASGLAATTAGPGKGGDIALQARAITLTDGALMTADTSSTGNAGRITVTAQELVRTANSTMTTNTRGSGDAGRIAVTAPTVEMTEGRISAATTSAGNAGDVVITAGRLALLGQAQIDSSSAGTGQGGQVTVTATEAITIGGLGGIASNAASQGAAGTVTITAPTLQMDGPVAIEARTTGAGDAGNVDVHVAQLHLTGGARIGSTSGTVDATGTVVAGPGRGGQVTVTATEALLISGQDNTGNESGVFSQTFGPGDAGRIAVTTPRLTLADGGRISAETGGDGHGGDVTIQAGRLELMSGAQINGSSGITFGPTRLVGAGRGGTVTLTATDPMLLTGQGTGLFTRTAGPGQGGDITVQAPRVTLTDGATISAESTGLGNAGNITLTLGDSFLSTHGSIVTRATLADGGNIRITAPNFLRLRDSAITAEVGGGATTIGGNIFIDPQFVLLQNSRIVANAAAGQGGNIRIQAQQVFLADPASQVSASSALGIDGQVAIQAPIANVSGTVASLPQVFARTGELLRDRCGERVRGGTMSHFVLGGRDGVPLEPGSLLLSPPVRAEQPALARMPESVAGQREVSFGPVRGLESDNTSYLSLRGPHVQAQWLEALDVECARWRWMQGTDVKTVP